MLIIFLREGTENKTYRILTNMSTPSEEITPASTIEEVSDGTNKNDDLDVDLGEPVSSHKICTGIAMMQP